RGVEAIRVATGQDRFQAFHCRLMPPHQVAHDLARSPGPNLDPGLTSWPLEVGQSGLDALLQCSDEGFDLVTRCHDRNPSPERATTYTASVGGAQTETAGVLRLRPVPLDERHDFGIDPFLQRASGVAQSDPQVCVPTEPVEFRTPPPLPLQLTKQRVDMRLLKHLLTSGP